MTLVALSRATGQVVRIGSEIEMEDGRDKATLLSLDHAHSTARRNITIQTKSGVTGHAYDYIWGLEVVEVI